MIATLQARNPIAQLRDWHLRMGIISVEYRTIMVLSMILKQRFDTE